MKKILSFILIVLMFSSCSKLQTKTQRTAPDPAPVEQKDENVTIKKENEAPVKPVSTIMTTMMAMVWFVVVFSGIIGMVNCITAPLEAKQKKKTIIDAADDDSDSLGEL